MKKKQKSSSIGKRMIVVIGATIFLSAFVTFTAFSEGRFIRELIHLHEPESMLFLGDVFLGRNVETLMYKHGHEYPFHRMHDLFDRHTYIIGNFESSIPKQHEPTPSFGFTFSIPSAFVSELARQGFTGVSLANNHSLDHGTAGYEHTQQVIRAAGITATGHPYRTQKNDVQWYTLNGQRIGIVPVNLTGNMGIDESTTEVVRGAATESDHLIVFVHWGPEYELTANQRQRDAAHRFVDLGADVVIGHHPHVVQDIERYEEGVIFYSLGNFIFDQYWMASVQEGLTLALTYENDRYTYDLIPITSTDMRSAPREMDREEADQFLLSLARRSDPSLQEDITRGVIRYHDHIQ